MQRSIMSFFHPKKEGKAKKPEKETSSRETEPPPKVALKERNGEVPENDSPVKRPGRKAARVLGSEGEEEDEALTPSKGQGKCPVMVISVLQIKQLTLREGLEESLVWLIANRGSALSTVPGTLRHPETAPFSCCSIQRKPLDPSGYNPAKNNYHPVDDACWKPGQKVPYLAVARTFEKIEEVSARLRMVETLSNLLRSVVALSPPDLLPILYLSLNRLGPPQQGLELGVGDGVLLKAVAQATGRQLESVKAEAAEKGDVGLVAENSRSTQRLMLPPPALTAAGVFAKFRDIAGLAGSASTAKKMDVIKGLFVACRHSEARFIARALSGRLRLGLAEQSVLAALAQAVSLTPPGQDFPPAVVDAGKGRTAEARKTWLEEQGMILKQTFCEVPDLDRIIPVLLEHGLEHLPEHCRLSPGVPLKPMLAHPTRGVSEVLKRFEEAAFTCEYKYDGQRAQLKKDYLDGVGDTLDLVVIGAYLGRGKRAGRYGGFLLAAYDEESEELQAICKLGTGFSDEELEDHFQSLQVRVPARPADGMGLGVSTTFPAPAPADGG
ncbi:DNA ligase 1 [Puma concolor]|uniref:DNA ligase 1 n=1 Tax=Puma concolor TaxID=9696 RepID=A0A6P6H3Z7_PUMCO|nr:DNA ligase 1 [Puma concolor]